MELCLAPKILKTDQKYEVSMAMNTRKAQGITPKLTASPMGCGLLLEKNNVYKLTQTVCSESIRLLMHQM